MNNHVPTVIGVEQRHRWPIFRSFRLKLSPACDTSAGFRRCWWVLVVGLVLVMGLPAQTRAAPQQMQITFAGYTNRTETLTNFPVLVVFSNNVAGSGFDYSNFVSTNGYDLRFSQNLADSTSYNYEIEKWDSSGASYVWVQVPTIPADGSGYMWAQWGDVGNSNRLACTTNGSVWSNGYATVWHLPNGTTLSGADSTANGNNGTVNGATAAAGCVDGGGNFVKASSQRVTAPYSATLAIVSNLTLEAWINAASFSAVGSYDNSVIGCDYESNQGYDLRCGLQGGIGTLGLVIGDGAGNWPAVVDSTGNMSVGQWYHVVGTYDKQNLKIYVNGQFRNSTASTASISGAAINGVSIGAGYPADSWGRFFDGKIDEARISSVARSSNWIWACYMNGASNTVFNSYGAMSALVCPFIQNQAATEVLVTSATLNGYLSSTGTSATAVWVYWGGTDQTTNASLWAYTNSFGTNTVGATTYSTNTADMGETLTKGATYYYNFYAQNASGGVWAATAESQSFTTDTNPTPAVTAPTGIDVGAATLNGTLVSDGGATTTVYLCWGTNDFGTSSTGAWPNVEGFGTKTDGQSVSTNLTGLIYGLRYWYRVYATNAAGGGWSAATNFVTAPPQAATGGTVTNYSLGGTNWTAHIFLSNGTFTVTTGVDVEYLVVGGGGAGGNRLGAGGTSTYGGGGGGGDYVLGSTTLVAEAIAITIGAGGDGDVYRGTSGSSTVVAGATLGTITAIGGGRGGGRDSTTGGSGGSGGGSCYNGVPGAATGIGEGNNGGDGLSTGTYPGGGGGGATAAGSDGAGDIGGDGGEGQTSSISGVSQVYASGGGAGGVTGAAGGTNAGEGASGGSVAGGDAVPNFGGGGGGVKGNAAPSGDGGSGIVIVRYLASSAIAITNTTATAIQTTQATLNGTLTGSNSYFEVWAYWGETNGTNNADGLWANTNYVGSFLLTGATTSSNIAYTATSGIAADKTYWYTFRATNACTSIWASPSASFLSLPDYGSFFEVDAAPSTNQALPFMESFDSLDLGSLDGTNGWRAGVPASVAVQTAKVRAGTKAAAITNAAVWHGFTDATATNVWIDWCAWANRQNAGASPSLDDSPSAAFYISDQGKIVARSNDTWVTFSAITIPSNIWRRFTVNLDYGSKTWALYVTDETTNKLATLVADELGFYSDAPTSLTSWRLMEATTAAYLDSFGATTNMPLCIDNNTNGISDLWETEYFGALTNGPGNDYDNDGISNLREYLAGTDPTDSDSYMRITHCDLAAPTSSDITLSWNGGNYNASSPFATVGDNIRRSYAINAANNDASLAKTAIGTLTDSLLGANSWTDTGATDLYSSRFYDLAVSLGGAGYTNTEEWAMFTQDRPVSSKHLVCVPVNLVDCSVVATGGIITNYSLGGTNWTAHIFLSNGTFTVTSGGDVEYLIVGGGGSGGRSRGGGGGAGGVLTGTTNVTATGYAIVVGAGGAGLTVSGGGNPGTNSTAFSLAAIGGGGGGGSWDTADAGGSGGGGSGGNPGITPGGAGTSGQGNDGGTGYWEVTTAQRAGAGGGGAGAVGGNASATVGGNGGAGVTTTIAGDARQIAGGGSGYGTTQGTASYGGGSTLGQDGTANTGGGGAATHATLSGAGGSGIVIIRYETGSGVVSNLNSTLGDQLARGLYSAATESEADTIEWFNATGGYDVCYLSSTGWVDADTGIRADVEVTPGMAFWVKRGTNAPNTRSNTVFTGKTFLESDATNFTFKTNYGGYTMFGWPLPLPRHHENTESTLQWSTPTNQLGFVAAGAVGGTSIDPSKPAEWGDSIWVWKEGTWKERYFLLDNGLETGYGTNLNHKWWDARGGFADFYLEPGKAYYYYHSTNRSGTNFTWKPQYPGGGDYVAATGGTVTNYSLGGTNWKAHIFYSNGTFTVTSGGAVEYLIVGGGAAGGGHRIGGGGGAGAVNRGSTNVSPGSISVTVGGGGVGATSVGADGGQSAFGALTAPGGGGGAYFGTTCWGRQGGCAGGSVGTAGNQTSTAVSPQEGYGGGAGSGSSSSNGDSGGGGGGAGGAGVDGVYGNSGDGGPGITSSITGAAVTYATGGTGGTRGAGGTPAAGAAGTGTGGEGSSTSDGFGGDGGSGIVIIRYQVE